MIEKELAENTNCLEWLQQWYQSQCDGDWEHGKGIQIGTTSNPGWFLEIDLEETELFDKRFDQIFIERSESDWIFCDKKDDIFEGYCGPFNLPEMISVFCDWAKHHAK